MRRLAAVWFLTVLLGAASYGVYKTRLGEWTFTWHQMQMSGFAPDEGFSYVAPNSRPELSSHERPSPAQILEDDRGLFGTNASRADIRTLGHGRFLFLNDVVYFSSSDESDPRTNGRHYVIWYPPIGRSASRALYGVTIAVALTAAGLLARLISVIGLLPFAQAIQDSVQSFTSSAASSAFFARVTGVAGPTGRRRALVLLGSLWLLTGLMLAASETTYLTRTGQWTWLWREESIGEIRPGIGFAYLGHTGRPEIGSQANPAPTALLENGVQVGLRNAPHVEIREIGRGRYSFWYDDVYFAPSDNSDPRTNGRRYTMSFPPVSRPVARVLYTATGALMFFTVLASGAALRAGWLVDRRNVVVARWQKHAVSVFGIAGACGLVLVTIARAFPGGDVFVDHLWVPVLLLNVVGAWAFRVRYGSLVPRPLAGAFLIALTVGLYFLAVWAPQRPQGCHTSAPYASWEMFCVAPDSASYYFKYTPGSTRNPLYPWFIEAATAGTGFSPQAYVAKAKAGAVNLNPRDPLLRVVRAQIVLMLAAVIGTAAALMWLLGSPLPAAMMLWMYDMKFFTAEELNIVLTEAVTQTFLLLTVAAFAAFFARKRRDVLVMCGAACGLAYLTRQASAYCVLLLGVMILVALWEDWRGWWRSSALALAAFVALCAVPALYSLAVTGSPGSQNNVQYQYRIAHGLQYATIDDLSLMPDQESREWLADAVRRRDIEHRLVYEKYDDEYNRMIYYINANLYSVATPTGGQAGNSMSPEFFMKVATPILARHWKEYLMYGFRFWQFGMDRPGLGRLGVGDFSPWLTYAVLWLLILVLRDQRAIASATLILAHYAAVAITCLFAVPIPRMVFASDGLVVIAALILLWDAAERFGATTYGSALNRAFSAAVGRDPWVGA